MDVPQVTKKPSAKKKTKDEPTQWQRRLGQDLRYNARMLEAMKPFMDMFLAKEEEEVDENGSDEGEAANDKAAEDDDVTHYANTTKDVFTPACPTTEGVVIQEQSTPITQTHTKRTAPKRRNR
ncbi:hypothetical protein GOBAR_DD17648 [Gossypium barbadense]|nr:hypothetical protein GOBAR_DD17648 [Gossypium barbadense]